MNKALLDTDLYSEVLRAVNATANARTYRQAYGRLTLSVITVMEMVKGLQKVQRPQTQKIAALLIHVGSEEVLEFGQPTSEMAGRIWGAHKGPPTFCSSSRALGPRMDSTGLWR